MFCIKCGTELDENMNFCPKCGSPVNKKVCKQCGEELKDGMLFCTKCGTPVGRESNNSSTSYSSNEDNSRTFQNESYYSQNRYNNYKNENNKSSENKWSFQSNVNSNSELSMTWYKVIIFGVLFGIIALALISGIGRIVTAISMLRYGIIGIGIFELIFAILFIGLAAAGIYVRQKLVNFNSNAPKFFIFWFIVIMICNIILNIVEAAILHNTSIAAVVFMIIFVAVFSFVNYIYFKNREHMFCN